jgi:hypothetical protein
MPNSNRADRDARANPVSAKLPRGGMIMLRAVVYVTVILATGYLVGAVASGALSAWWGTMPV